MKAQASVETGSDPDDPDGSSAASSGSDDSEEPAVEKIHEQDSHRADLHEAEYATGYLDFLSDFVRSNKLWLFLGLVAALVALWMVDFDPPRWVYFLLVPFTLTIPLTWSFVFNQVQKLDSEIDNVALEVSPDDDAETHAYIVGDGALPDFESENGVPPYPQQTPTTDVYEVETLDEENLSYEGPLRAALPYSEFVDVNYSLRYHRENIVPLADRVPKLESQLEAASLKGGIDRAVGMMETVSDALAGNLEDPDLDGDVDVDEIAGHGQEVENLQKEQESEVSADD
jgi:hypothetical protein